MASKKTSERQKLAMLAADAQQERDLQELRDIADDVIESDFVPYSCLYDGQTIITKDGELLQTIKITGTGFEAESAGNLRQTIRRAIRQCIPDESYAIWLHTLRRQQSLMGRAHFPDAFSSQLDHAWRGNLPSSASFVNELYITIVKAGEPAKLRDFKGILRSLHAKRETDERAAEIDRLATSLRNTTHAMLGILQPYGANLLTVVERNGVYYSEQLEFLEKLINLEERPMELPLRDLSHVLTSGEITFGYNAMEVRTHDDHRRFAAVITLKEYKESTLNGIDKFLEIPCEVIVTQCFSFTGAHQAQESYAKQARYLTISGDAELAKWMEIDRLMHMGNATGAQEYGQQQTTLFLISPSVRQLENNVRLVQKSLSRLGMVAVREDLRFEECYWAQLPGNFPFVVRQHPVDTEHLAGFANLQSAPMGVGSGSPWGPPVSLLSTVQDQPYFFNYHRGNSAHTVIVGRPGSGRTSFTHFLLSQTRKLPVAIWYVDVHGRGGPFIEAMGGSYVRPGSAQLKFNPFQLADTQSNRAFLALWISTLLDPQGGSVNSETIVFFQTLVDEIMKLPQENRRLSALLPILRGIDPSIAERIQPFCAGGAYGELFDMPVDTFTTSNLIGWDISRYCADPAIRVPLTSYLLHRITGNLTGSPTLIVLDEGFTQLNTPLFATRVTSWCDHLTAQNAGCIFMTDDIATSASYGYSHALIQRAATVFAMADPHADADYAMGFGFTPEDISTLSFINAQEHHVLQKRGEETTVLKMNLGGTSDPARATLSGRAKRVEQEEKLSPADQLAALMGFGSQPA